MKMRKTVTKLLLPLMLGLLLTVVAVSAPSVASAQDSKLLLPGDGPSRSGNYMLTYAHVLTNNGPLYRCPSGAVAGWKARLLPWLSCRPFSIEKGGSSRKHG